jgi:hypothetical protein
MTVRIERSYLAPMPCGACGACDDPTHIRPGGWGWKATDTDHLGIAGSSLEGPEAARSALRGAIAYARRPAKRDATP